MLPIRPVGHIAAHRDGEPTPCPRRSRTAAFAVPVSASLRGAQLAYLARRHHAVRAVFARVRAANGNAVSTTEFVCPLGCWQDVRANGYFGAINSGSRRSLKGREATIGSQSERSRRCAPVTVWTDAFQEDQRPRRPEVVNRIDNIDQASAACPRSLVSRLASKQMGY